MSDYSPARAAPSSTSEMDSMTSGVDSAPPKDSAPLKDKASDAAQAARQGGIEVAETAAAKAKDVAQETSRQARDLLGEARGQITEQAGSQQRSLVTNLRSLGEELGAMTDRAEHSGVATELVSQARERVDGAAEWLDGREPGDLLEEIRSFARRRPGAFLLGAAVAGVLAGRLTRGVVATHSDEVASPPAAVSDSQRLPGQPPAVGAPAAGYEGAAIGYSLPDDGAGDGGGAAAGRYGTEVGPQFGELPVDYPSREHASGGVVRP